MSEMPASLSERVSQREWYHTIELAPDVVTPGWFDLRGMPAKIPFPDKLAGKRCLDVGTFDGFWAFEMERRGAAEVIAIDVVDPQDWDWPAGSDDQVVASIGQRKAAGDGFEIAREALGSNVQRIGRSVYDLDPVTDGVFDFVYMGSLLIHLRDPVGALTQVGKVCTGQFLLVDNIDLALTLRSPRRPLAALDARGRPWWWKSNLAGLVRMVEAAGFDLVSAPTRCFMPAGRGQPRTKISVGGVTSRMGREILLRERVGDPHACILARPIRDGA